MQAAWHRLDRLLTGAEAVYVTMHGWADLGDTARILEKPLAEILEMVLDSRLGRVGKHALRQGFASILVNLSGQAPGHEMTTPGILAAGKGLEVNEVEVLLKRGLSPSSSGTGRRAGRAIVSLSAQDLAAFEARFISFRELALALRLSWDGLDERLAEHGIEPFSDGRRRFRKIYERAAVGPLLRG
ncbi:hypothetical protein [Frigidibacter sp. MR17.24]|uniref:hypothetical protein n=1 Tax=Frigidibacter sp. MR17.24 TaxID=3127345 RepID=UPI003012E34C